jgi:tRNA-modifying protein YgfZ
VPSISFAHLADRALIRVSGADASHFLQNLMTADLEDVDRMGAGSSALLTPQGKILFDFLIYKSGNAYLLDSPKSTATDLLKRLGFYRLRAKVDLELLPDETGVIAAWDAPAHADSALLSTIDPRLSDLGQRIVGPVDVLTQELEGKPVDQSIYEFRRIELSVAEGLKDYDYSDIFPHDANLDQLNGVSFSKGCYVGQEVVSRVHHRGSARKRFVPIECQGQLPAKGTSLTASGKNVGTMGSSISAGGRNIGIALLRLDKVLQAKDNDIPILCGDVEIQVRLPDWATFTWPETGAAD